MLTIIGSMPAAVDVFAGAIVFFALCAKLSAAVYCYRSCLCACLQQAGGICLCVFVGLLP